MCIKKGDFENISKEQDARENHYKRYLFINGKAITQRRK